MKQKNQRNSKRRLNSLVLLVAFTAIMLIVSTYAWFSANNKVNLTSLTGAVTVAEGLQISLDAKSWTNEIDLSNLATISASLPGDIKNITPSAKLVPVSTTGIVDPEVPMTDLTMYTGTSDGMVTLTDIKAADTVKTDGKEPGYYAFDLFVMNSTNGTEADVLQLNSDTKLTVGKGDTGLENSVRVAFARYGATAELTANQTTIFTETIKNGGTYTNIDKVAIWEPNANSHVPGVVSGNNRLVLNSTDSGKWSLPFNESSYLPTYGLTDAAKSATVQVGEETKTGMIENIYDWNSIPQVDSKPVLAFQKTLQTPVVASGAKLNNIYNLKTTDTTDTNLEIAANQITRLRVFLWLEGQDVDCINYASHGGSITLDLGLCKKGSPVANGS